MAAQSPVMPPSTPQQLEGSATKLWRTKVLSGSAPRRKNTPLRFRGQGAIRVKSATKSQPGSGTKRSSFASSAAGGSDQRQTMDEELESVMGAARTVLLRPDATNEEKEAGIQACRAAFRGIRQRHPRADYSADFHVTCARFEEFCGNFEAVADIFAGAPWLAGLYFPFLFCSAHAHSLLTLPCRGCEAECRATEGP